MVGGFKRFKTITYKGVRLNINRGIDWDTGKPIEWYVGWLPNYRGTEGSRSLRKTIENVKLLYDRDQEEQGDERIIQKTIREQPRIADVYFRFPNIDTQEEEAQKKLKQVKIRLKNAGYTFINSGIDGDEEGVLILHVEFRVPSHTTLTNIRKKIGGVVEFDD